MTAHVVRWLRPLLTAIALVLLTQQSTASAVAPQPVLATNHHLADGAASNGLLWPWLIVMVIVVAAAFFVGSYLLTSLLLLVVLLVMIFTNAADPAFFPFFPLCLLAALYCNKIRHESRRSRH